MSLFDAGPNPWRSDYDPRWFDKAKTRWPLESLTKDLQLLHEARSVVGARVHDVNCAIGGYETAWLAYQEFRCTRGEVEFHRSVLAKVVGGMKHSRAYRLVDLERRK